MPEQPTVEGPGDTDRRCQCVCKADHPQTAVADPCRNPREPGKFVIKSATGVGKVELAVCIPCWTATGQTG